MRYVAIPAKGNVGLVAKETKRGKREWKMAKLFADERCSRTILEFLRTTEVGRNVPVVRTDTESEAPGAEQEPGAAKMAEEKDRMKEEEVVTALGMSLSSS